MTDPRVESILAEVSQGLTSMAEAIVPWFFANMHDYYFRSHSPEEQVRHLQAIISGQVTTENQTVLLKSPCGTRITYITPGNDPDNIITAIEQLEQSSIQTARMYTSNDGALTLLTFHLEEQEQADPHNARFTEMVDSLVASRAIPATHRDKFTRFLSCTPADYIDKFEPGRAARQYALIEALDDSEHVHVSLEEQVYPEEDRITVAMRNPPRSGILVEVAKILKRYGVIPHRAYGDGFDLKDGNTALIVTLYVRNASAAPQEAAKRWSRMKQDLCLLKWYAADMLEEMADKHRWTLEDVVLLQAVCVFAHQKLLRSDPYAFTHDRVRHTMLEHPEMAGLLLDFFRARFDPSVEHREEAQSGRLHGLETAIANFSKGLTRSIFSAVLEFFQATLRTNRYLPDRFGLAFRLDPDVFAYPEEQETPFGIYFFHGPRFFGFHVRYRDMARGGVRVVRTRSLEQYKLESNRILSEVMDLARAQQIKNKDIPEGGSKAVLLLRPEGEVDMAVKSMANSLLDLIISTREEPAPQGVVDYLKRHEIIYLGPDENIETRHIQWIVNRARKRGYTWPAALMSSKPGAGISHKEYGVTSLGVVVFLEEVLKVMGIDPHAKSFTVKMTGGPAGDVAGNAMKIMMRDFGATARIVAVSDGHGAAYDPKGLDHQELYRLVRAELSIDGFDPAKLRGKDAFVVTADTQENRKTRDELHNRVKTDVFLPCGGRPDTINATNWHHFLDKNGLPTAGAIVEGANIFLSNEARLKLQEENVLIVHGSSANKCGVIASSYEVLAGLILSDEEFLAIKEEYVGQVLTILERRARDEARLLLHEFKLYGGKHPLTTVTLDLSAEINTLGDKIAEALFHSVADLTAHEHLCRTLLEYCPAVLAREYHDRIVNELPVRYRFALLGAHLSSYIVYTEGTGWLRQLLQVRDVGRVIEAYLEQGKAVGELLETLSVLEDVPRREIAHIVRTTGRKYLTARSLGLE